MQQPSRYTVQVLLPYSQALDPDVIHHQLRAWRPDVELVHGDETEFGFAIPLDSTQPLLVHVCHAPVDAYAAELAEALEWSPQWPDRYIAVSACTTSIVISMVSHRSIPDERQRALPPTRRRRATEPPANPATMLLAFLAVLDTVLATCDDLRPAVLHWMPAQRVLAFSSYRMSRMELGPCGPAINVRIAAISEHDMLADTVGLAELGLPDLQTVVHDGDPNELTMRLVGLARSMFVGDALDCTWTEEASLTLPDRNAITVQLD